LLLTAPLIGYFLPSSPTWSIEKSENDIKSYENYTLDNGLEVVLIHDPGADQGAASLDVKVGQLQDPKNRQGLAHYLEHMLFLGNKKYPTPGGFASYLSQHGGNSNAFTALEDTNYYFAVNSSAFEGALDRFAQFFIAPTFDPAYAIREINAVHSEHQKNLTNDFRRMYQLQKGLYNPAHPITQFGTGSLESLGGKELNAKSLEADLKAFYEGQYSANRMKLVVSGPQEFKQMKQWVTQSFAAIKNKQLGSTKLPIVPLITAPLPRLIQVQSVKEQRLQKLSWVIPPQKELWQQKPSLVLGQLLGDEGEGSLLSYLKDKGWGTRINASSGFGTQDFGLFELYISLTPEGLNHWKEINQAVFSYIEKIKKDTNLQRYQDELNTMGGLEFKFLPETKPAQRVQNISMALHNVPFEHVLSSPYRYAPLKKKDLNGILNQLTPENLSTYLSSQDIETDLTERWYQTKYAVRSIDPTTLKSWQQPGDLAALQLPKKNPFIPKNVVLVPENQLETARQGSQAGDPERAVPLLGTDQPGLRVWVKPDTEFHSPKIKVKAVLSTTLAYDTPRHAALTNLYTKMLTEQLNEWVYPARIAGSAFGVGNGIRGLELSVEGYPETVSVLLDKLTSGLQMKTLDPDRFAIQLRRLKEDRLNQQYSKAYHRAMYEFAYLTSQQMWHNDDYLKVIPTLGPKDLEAFIPELLKRLHIEVLVTGNLRSQMAIQLGQRLKENIGAEPLAIEEIPEQRSAPHQPHSSTDFPFEVQDNNSAIHLYFQAGLVNSKQSALLTLLSQMIQKPAYHQLRTTEQLGYVVWSMRTKKNNLEGLSFVVQSAAKDPAYLKARILEFTKNYQAVLEATSAESFEGFKGALVEKLRQPTKNLSEDTGQNWRPILDRSLKFTEKNQLAQAIQQLTLEEVAQFYRGLVLTDPTLVSIQAYAKGLKAPAAGRKIQAYRSSLTYAPNPPGTPENAQQETR